MSTIAYAPSPMVTGIAWTDIDHLQGSWTTVAGPRQARLLIAGTRFAFAFVSGDVYIGSYTIDPGSDPKSMDMRIDEGPPSHHGQLALCIYHLDGDTLKWCPARPGRGMRPSEFAPVDDPQQLCLVFTRDHSPRRR